MENSFADLFSNAFSESSFPTLCDEDLDFESLSSDEKLREDRPCTSLESAQANKNKTLHQEVTDQAADQSDAQTHDVAAAKDLLDKEYFCGLGLTGQMQEDHRSSDGDSAEGGSVPEEEEDDEEDKEEVEEQDYEEDDKGDNEDKEEDCEEKIGGRGEEGDFLMSTCCSGDFCDGWKEDRTLSEGQPLTLEGSRNPQDRNEEQEGDSDEDLSYFERVPGLSSATRIKGDGADGGEQEQEEGKQEDLSGSENEDVITEEGRAPTLCFDQEEDEINMDTGFELVAKVDLECPDNDLASQNPQGLTADGEAVVGKIRDFVGEEHQEAGESFADYPSDFSSSEYEESGSKSPTGAPWENIWVVRDGGDLRSEEGAKGDNEGEERVDSMLRLGSERSGEGVSEEDEEDELEEDEVEDEEEEDKKEEELEDEEEQEEEKEQEEDEGVGELLEHELGDAAAIRHELGESDSYSSSEDEASLSRSEEEFADGHLQPEEELRDLSGGLSNTYTKWSSSEESTGFDQSWNPDTLTLQSRPAESQELCTTSVGPTWPAVIKGSVDDSFFFNTEAPGTTAAGELEEEEYEEERNWEQEQERIKAFFEFYDSSDGEKSEERQPKVQFCKESLSQVIQYETDSDEDSLCSSTEGEEELSSAETSEDVKECEDSPEVQPACGPLNIQPPEAEPDVHTVEICTRKRQGFKILSATLKTGAITVMGLLMFWVADQSGWLSELSLF